MFHSRIARRHLRILAALMAFLFAFFFLIPANAFAAAEETGGSSDQESTAYEVTYELEHLTADGATEAFEGQDFEVRLIPDAGYTAPEQVEVYVNGELLTEGEDYSYSSRQSDDEDETLDDEDEDSDDDEEDLEDDEEDLEDDEEDLDDDEENLDDDEDSDDDEEDLDNEDEDSNDDEEDLEDEDEDSNDDEEDLEDDEEDLDDDEEDLEDDEEDLDDDEEDFDDGDEDFGDEDEDSYDYFSATLRINGDAITGPVLIRASANELEYASGGAGVNFDDAATPTSGPSEELPADAVTAKDYSPPTGDLSGKNALLAFAVSALSAAILVGSRRRRIVSR